MTRIGRLTKVPLRELWKHEERGFSAWLENNLDILSETIGLNLSAVEREKPVGAFAVDLVAEDNNGGLAIIENQLEQTDHDHLGKLVTYLSNLEAKTAVWITSRPRPEHIRAVSWLNESTPDDVAFFIVKLEAFKIGESEPAPLLTAIVGPTPESKQIGRDRKNLAERHVLRLKFWEKLLTRAKSRGVLYHANMSPCKDNWLVAGAGKTGLGFAYVVRLRDTSVGLYIDTGEKEANKKIFDKIHSHKHAIEEAFGAELDWQRLESSRGSHIVYTISKGGISSPEETWPETHDAMIDAMDKLAKAVKPYF